MRASLFITCVVDMFQPKTGVAAVNVLRAAGCEVSCPLGQTCCGQPAWNSGFVDEAARVAATSLDALADDDADVVVVPAGSCATMMKVFWPEMFELAGDHRRAALARSVGERTHEFSEFIAQRRRDGVLPDIAIANAPTVAYHHSCHMLRELDIEAPPRELVDAVGCSSAPWDDAFRCCGFGGLFSMKLPDTSVAMADQKLTSIPEGVDVLVGSDGSCLMHLQSRIDATGRFLPVKHLAELLNDALQTPLPAVTVVEGEPA